MNKTPKLHAMIVAAGRGSRFGASVPKQYTILGNQTLLQHSVGRLAQSEQITECLLVVAADDNTAQNLKFAMPVFYATGGTERWQSVSAGIEAIMSKGASDDDLILIHDAARPTVPLADIDEVIAAAKLEPYGAILAAPVADTLKQAQQDDTSRCYVSHTVDREGMWQAQTPQVFRAGALTKVLEHVALQHLSITDEASAFEYLNLPIRLVTGSQQNIKLTYADDELLILSLIQSQK
ncbi:2-C-methyl-D-erythritol 4-phosphate cytidylyltransferase [Psychrobacter sp. T6-1]|uniref:2-C-methyl-D-erythritol 4-phosphate cytidylyltransferase n=1 Tax=Psychrobacter sp. T6-1 TaxID=3457447 RepID=UPI003FD0ABDB